MRGWQALCILSRFVTLDIAEHTANVAFAAMEQESHNSTRYFLEIFVVRCATIHPAVFGSVLLQQIKRTDLSLQMISSLMIVCGNLVVGRYAKDFFKQYDKSDKQESTRRRSKVTLGTRDPMAQQYTRFQSCDCAALDP